MPYDFKERQTWNGKPLSLLQSVIVIMITLVCAYALLGAVSMWADQVEKAIGCQDRAEQMRDTKLAKEMRNEY
jgi:hypothetical protein